MNKLRILFASTILFLLACLCAGTAPATPRATTPTAVQPNPGATVVYDAPTNTPVPVATATKALGQTRDAPYPLNTTVEVSDSVLLTINMVRRPADDVVAQGNRFNDTPEPNTEYMIVSLHLECDKPANQTCRFSAGDIKTVGASGTVHDQARAAGIPQEMEYYNEFFGGSMLDGNLVFIATKNDLLTVLFYDPLFGGKSAYISLVQ